MIVLQPIGIVRNSRHVVEDDQWGGIVSDIEVTEPFGPEGLTGIAFSPFEGEPGPLELQGDHGPVAYRDIRMRTIFD